MDVPGIIRTINEAYFSEAYAGRRFAASLPAGSYTAEFLDENDNPVWPQYVEEYWQKVPDCTGYAEKEMVTIVPPDVEDGYCDELVRNGGQDGTLTLVEPWEHTMGQPRVSC